MLGDISDEVELDSGIGQQGLMFASSSLIGKLNRVRILMAGITLEFINFPQGTNVEPTAKYIQPCNGSGPLVAILMIIPFGIFYYMG